MRKTKDASKKEKKKEKEKESVGGENHRGERKQIFYTFKRKLI